MGMNMDRFGFCRFSFIEDQISCLIKDFSDGVESPVGFSAGYVSALKRVLLIITAHKKDIKKGQSKSGIPGPCFCPVCKNTTSTYSVSPHGFQCGKCQRFGGFIDEKKD